MIMMIMMIMMMVVVLGTKVNEIKSARDAS